MKILLIFIFSILLSMSAFASTREIVILTSIQTPKTLPFWKSKTYEISKDIEEQYQKAFVGSGYDLVFHHNSDRETLEFYLQSPKTLALFWVSHAASEARVSGLNLASIIQDVNGNNVKNVFQKINPNVKFLSVVGCSAGSILEEFKARGFYHSDLTIHSFDKKISLNNGILQSLKAASKVIDHDPSSFRNPLDALKNNCNNKNCYRDSIIAKDENETDDIPTPSVEGISVTITNTNPKYSAELSVNDQFIGVLKKGNDSQEFIIPQKLVVKKLKLKVNFDVLALEKEETMEPLEIAGSDRYLSLEFLKDKAGRPYGKATNFYYLQLI